MAFYINRELVRVAKEQTGITSKLLLAIAGNEAVLCRNWPSSFYLAKWDMAVVPPLTWRHRRAACAS